MSNLTMYLICGLIGVSIILIWNVISAHLRISELDGSATRMETEILKLQKLVIQMKLSSAKVGSVYAIEGRVLCETELSCMMEYKDISFIGVYKGIGQGLDIRFETSDHQMAKLKLNDDFMISDVSKEDKEKFKQEYNLE